ncbi:hypothetical protein C8T65DRAFT_145207 [Cerioporus squamosus]|nr:hypothetical protein C8T65DRAFT_145207 [Cerioporus squamosus]
MCLACRTDYQCPCAPMHGRCAVHISLACCLDPSRRSWPIGRQSEYFATSEALCVLHNVRFPQTILYVALLVAGEALESWLHGKCG